jgi:putative endopeptidase
VAATDRALADLIGQRFVRDRFAGDSKVAAEGQVHAIVAAMAANLAALPWMDATTKARAKDKLAAMSYQIGYPKTWHSYPFAVDPAAFGDNAIAARQLRRSRDLAKIGHPVDRDEWNFPAPTVNAEYQPAVNGMFFPAGILQPPFYSVAASIPVNLGGMGVVVGHELTHGFDDQGAQYDAVGNVADWWQPETGKQFKARTQCVIDQYSGYAISGVQLNGANTVGENIADIGGVKLALAAYRALRAGARDAAPVDGFSEDQQFFLGFGQAWCAVARPDFEKMLATIDVHAPPRWRVNGALAATPEFAAVWGCKAGAPMAPAKPCVVW